MIRESFTINIYICILYTLYTIYLQLIIRVVIIVNRKILRIQYLDLGTETESTTVDCTRKGHLKILHKRLS